MSEWRGLHNPERHTVSIRLSDWAWCDWCESLSAPVRCWQPCGVSRMLNLPGLDRWLEPPDPEPCDCCPDCAEQDDDE